MRATLQEFLQTGRIGEFGLGVSRATVRNVLGTPESDGEQLGSLVQDIYGDVEFEFSRADGAVLIMVALYCDPGSVEFGDRDHFCRMGYSDFVKWLEENGVGFEHRASSDHPYRDSLFKLDTGVLVTIGEENPTTVSVVNSAGLRAAR